ncbi:S41 family peptidase [Uliginosibacterium sediminicola]|uniref:S41 family peptidase n=1 Tax=Uliginosibacterium sediminicola TaxID=2024550 RepID=A0ABU9Z316_9RHOO
MSSRFKQFGLVFSGICIGVLISLNFAARADRESPVAALPVEQMRKLADAFNNIKRFYVDSVDDKKLLDDAISGMVSGLDPHSSYLDEEGNKEMDESIKGEFGGLGLQVEPKDGYVKVESPMEGTPAFRAGVKAGDLVIKIDGETVKGLTISQAVKKMRGVPGTKVTLTIFRSGMDQPFDVPLVREVIQVRSVRSKLLEPGYGYVRVSQFQERTVPDLVRHIADLAKQGPLKGLVLDLRNDPGGLLDGAVGVSAAFLPKGSLVVYTDGRAAGRKDYKAEPEEYSRGSSGDVMQALPAIAKTVPLVVLVNGGSASASEIVSGALQDYKRATIIGTPTFGKASVQTKFDFPDGKTAMKLTIARYYTPNGRSIQAKGIVPDIVVEESPDAVDTRLREADLPKHLLNPKEVASQPAAASAPLAASEPQAALKPSRKPDGPVPPVEFGSKDDWQLGQAVLHLKGLPLAKPAVAAAPAEAESAPAVK